MTASLVEPAYLHFPEYQVTLGPEVGELCHRVGFGPDPDQQRALDIGFAKGPNRNQLTGGLLSAVFELAIICSRQNLKTGLFKQFAIGWLFITDERLVMWSAHEFSTSLEAFKDIDELITGSDILRRRVKTIHRAHGEEAIELNKNLKTGAPGTRLRFRARTRHGARGLTGDKLILDEAFALLPDHMGTLLPTLSARPDPQVLYGSSAGLAWSDVLRGIRDRGRRGGDPRLGYIEWCDERQGEPCARPRCTHAPTEAGCVLDDETRWKAANPALGRRITIDHIRAERKAMPPMEFARERLGWWDDPTSEAPIPLAGWTERARRNLTRDPGQRPVFGIDASPGLRSAAITLAAMTDRGIPMLDYASHAPGTDWVVARAKQLQAKHDPQAWAIDPSGPAGALMADLRAAGIELTELSPRDMGQGCTNLAAKVTSGGIVHTEVPTEEAPSGGPLTRAIAGAGKKDIGDGLWTWRRTKSDADICPVVAATAALWVLFDLQPVEDSEPGVYYV